MAIRYTFLSIIAATIFTACSGTPDVEGSWVGAPSQLTPSGTAGVTGPVANSQVVTRITFNPSADDSSRGTVTLNSDINIMDEIRQVGEIPLDAPYEISVSAIATINGSYHFEDEDDIVIALDNNSLNVQLDPDAVKFTANALTGEQNPEISSLKNGFYWDFSSSITSDMRLEYARYQKISDVKVRDGIMSCEINDQDLSFRKLER